MSIQAQAGPIVVFGQAQLDNNPDLAPSMFWGGVALLDPRTPFTFIPGESQAAQDFAWLGTDNITTLSIVPYTANAAAIAPSAASATTNVALVTASSATTGVYLSPSITRSDTGVVDTGVGGAGIVAIDAYVSIAGVSIANGVMTLSAAGTAPVTPGLQLLTTTGAASGAPLAGAVVQAQLTGT